ncbi:MAG TPA: PD-(D/E)XK nuclease family protein, partial [Balneolales bacterium]|nr:PD-(D/E)XK nuclease family protein [Balneolales bacterium]
PDIRPLENWLDELAMLSQPADSEPLTPLAPDERTLVLREWLRANKKEALRKWAAPSTVRVLSDLIADMHRADVSISEIVKQLTGRGVTNHARELIDLLEGYRDYLEAQKWTDREALPGRMNEIATGLLTYPHIILYEPDYLFESQKKGLSAVLNSLSLIRDSSLNLLQYESAAADAETPSVTLTHWLREHSRKKNWHVDESQSGCEGIRYHIAGTLDQGRQIPDDENTALQKSNRIHIQEVHNARAELEQALRIIRWRVATTPAGQQGSRFSDYVVLVSDLTNYEPLVLPLGKSCEVPLTATRGPARNSHPVVRRFLLLLSLKRNGFSIDDIYQVFADNLFKVRGLDSEDPAEVPNIRSFCQFCRAYNFRTLEEADAGLENAMVRRRLSIQQTRHWDEDRKERELGQVDRDKNYFSDVIDALNGLRRRYLSGGDLRPLSDWVIWAGKLIDEQDNLGDPKANVTRSQFSEILDELVETHQRLGLNPSLSMNDFLDLVDLSLRDNRERSDDLPEAVRLTEVGYFPDTHRKTVFLLGLSEGSFPKPVKTDYLRFRYQNLMLGLLRNRLPDSWLEARHRLFRQIENAAELFISRPRHREQRSVIGSALWQDLTWTLSWESNQESWAWPLPDEKYLITDADERLHDGTLSASNVARTFEKDPPAHARLIASVGKERRNQSGMGLYDGDLRSAGRAGWDEQLANVKNDWWRHQTDSVGTLSSSISQLDQYAISPLEFFFQRVLRLEPLEEYSDEIEATVKGDVVHKILQEYYTRDSTYAPGLPVIAPSLISNDEKRKQAWQRLMIISEKVLEDHAGQTGYTNSPFPGVFKLQLQRLLDGFLKREMARSGMLLSEPLHDLKPAGCYPDSRFGMEYGWAYEPELKSVPFPVRLRGFIDRIDHSPDGKQALVFDYKTGTSSVKKFKDDINKGMSFQLPVYARALLHEGCERFAGGYYVLPFGREQSKIVCTQLIGEEAWFNPDLINGQRGGRLKDFLGLMEWDEFQNFLDQLVHERMEWILNHIHDGLFNLGFAEPPVYSDFKWIERYDPGIQKARKRAEEKRLIETTQTAEDGSTRVTKQLNRYYLDLEVLTST